MKVGMHIGIKILKNSVYGQMGIPLKLKGAGRMLKIKTILNKINDKESK